MMSANKKRERITFQKNTPANNAAGQPRPTWSHFVTVYGSVESNGGTEAIKAGIQRRESITHIITIRSTRKARQITAKYRALWKGRTFEIESAIEPENDNTEIEIEATEIVA